MSLKNFSLGKTLHEINEKIVDGKTIRFDREEYEIGDLVFVNSETLRTFFLFKDSYNIPKYKDYVNRLFVVSDKKRLQEEGYVFDNDLFSDHRWHYEVVMLDDPDILLFNLLFNNLIRLKP